MNNRIGILPKAIVTARDDERTVAIEVHGRDGIAVRRQGLQTFARLYVPNAHVLVEL